jgi:hypothetical protein
VRQLCACSAAAASCSCCCYLVTGSWPPSKHLSPWHYSVQESCKALAPQQLLHLLCWQLLRCCLRRPWPRPAASRLQ